MMVRKSSLTKEETALLQMADALLEAIAASGSKGMPEGHLYAAVMGMMSLDQFNQFMSGLEGAGKMTRRHHVCYITEAGKR